MSKFKTKIIKIEKQMTEKSEQKSNQQNKNKSTKK